MPDYRTTRIWVKLVEDRQHIALVGHVPLSLSFPPSPLSLLPRIRVHHFVSYAYAYWIFRWKAPRAEIPDETFAFSLRLDK